MQGTLHTISFFTEISERKLPFIRNQCSFPRVNLRPVSVGEDLDFYHSNISLPSKYFAQMINSELKDQSFLLANGLAGNRVALLTLGTYTPRCKYPYKG